MPIAWACRWGGRAETFGSNVPPSPRPADEPGAARPADEPGAARPADEPGPARPADRPAIVGSGPAPQRPDQGRLAQGRWYALAGWLTGALLASFVGAAVIAAAGWDPDVKHRLGSAAGHVAGRAAAGEHLSFDDVPMWAVGVLQIPLWVGLAGAPLVFRRRAPELDTAMGLKVRWSDWPAGIVVGVVMQVIAVPALYAPLFWLIPDLDSSDVAGPAQDLVARANGLGIAVLALVVVIGAPVVEELFYRGLLLRSLEATMRPVAALGVTSIMFAVSHFQLIQLPALVLIGVVLGLVAQRTGRLAPAIATHLGFNLTTVVTLLAG